MNARGATPVLRSSGVVRQRDVPAAAGAPAGVGVVAVGLVAAGAVGLAVPAGVADEGELDAMAPAELVDPPAVVAVAPRAPLVAAPACGHGAGEGAGAGPPTAPDEHAANTPMTAVSSET